MRVRSMTRMPSRGSTSGSYRAEGASARRAQGGDHGHGVGGGDVTLADDDVAVLRIVGELAPVAAALAEVEGDAGIDRPAVDVQGDHRLGSLDHHLVDRLD